MTNIWGFIVKKVLFWYFSEKMTMKVWCQQAVLITYICAKFGQILKLSVVCDVTLLNLVFLIKGAVLGIAAIILGVSNVKAVRDGQYSAFYRLRYLKLKVMILSYRYRHYFTYRAARWHNSCSSRQHLLSYCKISSIGPYLWNTR